MNQTTEGVRKSIWSRAKELAGQAPPERNRYVDFLRALSILAVVVGHWLVAAPYMKDGAVEGGHLLGILPWTQWLTWGFQVMPLFFLVGGFSNGMSWAATLRNGGTYESWYSGRLQRLINPVLPLFLIWTLAAMFGTLAGIDRTIVAMAAQLALIRTREQGQRCGVALAPESASQARSASRVCASGSWRYPSSAPRLRSSARSIG